MFCIDVELDENDVPLNFSYCVMNRCSGKNESETEFYTLFKVNSESINELCKTLRKIWEEKKKKFKDIIIVHSNQKAMDKLFSNISTMDSQFLDISLLEHRCLLDKNISTECEKILKMIELQYPLTCPENYVYALAAKFVRLHRLIQKDE